MILEIFRLSGIKPKLNKKWNTHDKGVYTKEIEDLAMEMFMPSIPGEVEFFSNEGICIISKEEVCNRPNEQGGGWGIVRFRELRIFSANVGPRFLK